ncbi:MAG: hypothetical protein EAZ24_06565 [Burkholderiales bacterium]|nr:MAG: hypothetical protein EAZ21_13225 [Betaproteobacteria bacterium]TAG78603.1 MAG: hypothetical protein EAZ24_06565 [Burkholderiales bacterium]
MTTEGFTRLLSHTAAQSSRAHYLRCGVAARQLDHYAIAHALQWMRSALCEHIASLTPQQLVPPPISTINPPLWEAAHVGWFAEWFCVRGGQTRETGEAVAMRASCWAESDAFLNSNLIAHDARWRLPQLSRQKALDYLQRSLELTLRALDQSADDDESLYRFRLALFHEAMHLEALAWMAQTLAWPVPGWLHDDFLDSSFKNSNIDLPLIEFGQERYNIGFRFDNEIGVSPCQNKALVDKYALVTNAQFLSFVERGDYAAATGRAHPAYWRRSRDEWQTRSFDRWQSIAMDAPVIHVSAIEAEAFARWAGGRLPTEAELQVHFSASPKHWHGQVWEWTSTMFAPYEAGAFVPGLYREYSAPWFDGRHRVLRGGSFATLPYMHHPQYRNFFTPERYDVFAGFRVVSL